VLSAIAVAIWAPELPRYERTTAVKDDALKDARGSDAAT
jgi:hypothetical protein